MSDLTQHPTTTSKGRRHGGVSTAERLFREELRRSQDRRGGRSER